MAYYLSSRPQAGQSLQSKIRFHGALHQMSCCAAAMQNMHILSHCFFTKIERFAHRRWQAKTAPILAEMSRPDRPMRRRAGAAEALLPARNDFPVVDIVRNA